MTYQRVVLREIDWLALFPWLRLFQLFTIATRLPLIVLAALAYYLVPLGWWISSKIFLKTDAAAPVVTCNLGDGSLQMSLVGAWGTALIDNLVMPFQAAFSAGSVGDAAYFTFGGLWAVLVWGFAAAAITRYAVVHAGRQERLLLKEALSFVKQRYLSYIAAPLFPLGAVAIMALLLALVGLPLRFLSVYGYLLAVGWVFVLALSWSIAFLMVGLFFGWPLMWPTISAEKTGDMFEATSRSYSYIMQRPLHLLWYLSVATAIGTLGFIVVELLSTTTNNVAAGSIGAFAGDSTFNENAAAIIKVISRPITDLPSIFACSYFWSMVSVIYLLVRRDTEQTEIDAVYVEDEEVRYGLPPLENDERGVPGVAEEASPAEDTSESQPEETPPESEALSESAPAAESDDQEDSETTTTSEPEHAAPTDDKETDSSSESSADDGKSAEEE